MNSTTAASDKSGDPRERARLLERIGRHQSQDLPRISSNRPLLMQCVLWLCLASGFVSALFVWERADTPLIVDTFKRSGEYSWMPTQNQLWSARLRLIAMHSLTEPWSQRLADEFENARDVFYHRVSLIVDEHALAADFRTAPSYALVSARMLHARETLDKIQLGARGLSTQDARGAIKLLDELDPLMVQFTADLRNIDLSRRSTVYETILSRQRLFHLMLFSVWLVLCVGGLWALRSKARIAARQRMEREALERKLAALQTAEELLETRNSILNMVAHDLRSPLQVLMNTAEVLQIKLPKDQPALRALVQQIDFSTEQIATHLRDLTSMAKTLDASTGTQLTGLDLDQIGQQSFTQSLRETATLKGLNVQVAVDGMKRGLLGDPTRITQIVGNLIENAIKYTNHGSVNVMIETRPFKEHVLMLTITVTDTGLGMTDTQIKKAFDPFVRLDSAVQSQANGYGLGLSLVKHLVELLEGTLEVRSTPGIGTAFVVLLPTIIERSKTFAKPSDAYLEIGAGGALVLVVDDIAEVRNALVETLKRQGASAVGAASASEALALAKVQHFDLALIDYQMPERNGLSLAAELSERYPQMQLVIISAFPESEIFSAAALSTVGAHGFAEKPVKGLVLRHWIDRAIERRKSVITSANTETELL